MDPKKMPTLVHPLVSEKLDGSQPWPVVLTIAGFDPSSGAGLTADLKTFAAHSLYGVSCATALTVQSTQGVRRVIPVDAQLLAESLACLAQDVLIAGIKIGMLGTAPVAGVVADFLARGSVPKSRVVLDPVLRSSSGAALLDAAGLQVMRERLLPVVGWITPNVDELAVLVSLPSVTRAMVPEAASRLRQQVALVGNAELTVIATGGHLDRPDDYLLEAGVETGTWIEGQLVETTSTHGTGCAFSSALLAQLIRGTTGARAVAGAKSYVTEALKAAYPVGKGRSPMNHLYRYQT